MCGLQKFEGGKMKLESCVWHVVGDTSFTKLILKGNNQ